MTTCRKVLKTLKMSIKSEHLRFVEVIEDFNYIRKERLKLLRVKVHSSNPERNERVRREDSWEIFKKQVYQTQKYV